MKKFLLFDIDGTLINSNGAGRIAFEQVFTELSGENLDLKELDFRGKTDKFLFNEIHRLYGHKIENPEEFSLKYIKYLKENMVNSKSYLIPGVMETLSVICKSNNFIPGLLTGNMYDGARIKLEFFDIFKYFPFGIFGDFHEERNQLAFEAIKKLNHLYGEFSFSTKDIFIIGDTPFDIQCGKAIGAKTVAITTGSHSYDELHDYEPDHILENLEDVSLFLSIIKG